MVEGVIQGDPLVEPPLGVDAARRDGEVVAPLLGERHRAGVVVRLVVGGRPIAPDGISARNPAFDVTPHRYVTGIVTEAGIVYPPFEKNLRAAVEQASNVIWSEIR